MVTIAACAPALALLAAGCGSGTDAGKSAPAPSAQTIAAEAKETVERLMASARDRLGLGSEAAPAPSAPAEEPAGQPRPARRSRAADAPEETNPTPMPVPAARLLVAFAAAPGVVQDETPPPDAPEPDDTVYSSADAEVDPPMWQRVSVSAPQLAGSPDEAPDIELILSADGSVERARLLSVSRRLPDMMILSSAKTWMFEPALRDGQPVRYRLIVRLNDTSLE